MLLSPGDQSFSTSGAVMRASPSFKPRENSASRCRQKGSIADEVIELHVAVLHRTQVSPPMVELGHELPRRLAERAAVMPPKAAASSRDQGGRGGPQPDS